MLGQFVAHLLIAALIVDGVDFDVFLLGIIQQAEQFEFPDQARGQELLDKALILEALHGELECGQPVAAGDVGEPVTVLFLRILTDAPQVPEHGEAQRVRVYAGVVLRVERRLIDHLAVVVQKFQHKAVGDLFLIIEIIEQGVVPERGPPLVHDLGLTLWIKVLGHLPHDTDDLPLPGFQQRRVLFNEVENVFLGLRRKTFVLFPPLRRGLQIWKSPP